MGAGQVGVDHGEWITIRSKALYVERHGDPCYEPVLYLHGGPGASCVDFCHFQAKPLSEHLYVIALDQRGVFRSEALDEADSLGLSDLILDMEALRELLQIKQWHVIGHSFGGYLALRYALQHPSSVKRIIYETPSFNIADSMRSLISRSLAYFDPEDEATIQACHSYISGQHSASELLQAWGQLGAKLGEQREFIYFHGIHPSAIDAIFDAYPQELWQRSNLHTMKLMQEGEMNIDISAKLAEAKHRSLLIQGRHDPVCTPQQQDNFTRYAVNGDIVYFEHSAHMPRAEEPTKYTETVLAFLAWDH